MICISSHAVLDDRQKQLVFNIQPYTVGHLLFITRGHSSPLDQLRTIERYAILYHCLFSEFIHDNLFEKVDIWHDGAKRSVYPWQQTWSMLLHLYSKTDKQRGAKINPPVAAECLFDYFADGRNKKGELIAPSPHIKLLEDPKPCPLDFSERIDGKVENGEMVGGTHDLNKVSEILQSAKKGGVGIRNITIEPANGCAHIDPY